MENFSYDWSRFIKRVNLKADIATVYAAWATRQGLEQWFLRQALFTMPDGSTRPADSPIQAGDKYAWLWHGYDDTTTEYGEILEADGISRLKFIFGVAGKVTISIYAEQDETIVELLQDEIPVDEKGKAWFHLGCSTGWVFYLANLKAVLEGGLDLRNKNMNLKNVVTA